MPDSYTASFEPTWRAIVVARRPLHYVDGADAHADRPAHVRAGSSLAWLGPFLALVQDDANFVALIDPRDASTRAIALPAARAACGSLTTRAATRRTSSTSRRASC
ncbi:MAG: hypothetical protein IPN16_19770 [Gemmatimonadetes bacterium]|nr:hypothetical protein [Gemmatimonadota bacterium]